MIIMCDKEVETLIFTRLTAIEIGMGAITNDLAWIKKIIGVACIAIGSVYGLDVAGVV